MGLPWKITAIDFDAIAGQMRGILKVNQGVAGDYGCWFDAGTGQVTMLPIIAPTLVGITAMAINGSGVAYVATTPGPKLHQVDLATGLSSYLGGMAVPTSLATDLAFDTSGLLWASLFDVGNGADTGLYTIHPTSYAATRVIALPSPYTGIAFGKKTLAQPYCAPKTSSLSCVPILSADGFASPTAKLGFTVSATDLNNNRTGLLFYGSGARTSTPFQGGLLCLAPPISRSPAANTGGTPTPALDCSGTWSIDYNAMIWAKYGANQSADLAAPIAFLIPGTTIRCQWWGRDPGFAAPNNSMLSDGLEFVLSP
jgi:hypothetical protein